MRSPHLLFAFFVSGACALVACSNGSSGPSGMAGTTGAAGTTSMAGTTGAAGTAGATSTAGTTGAAGTTSMAGTTGAAGTTSAAGTTGSAGAAGATATSGTTGSAGTGGATGVAGAGGSTGSVKSLGCGKDNGDGPTAWTQHDIMVTKVAPAYSANFTSRTYWTRPPYSYDPQKPVALFLWGQGCGQGGNAESIPPSENVLITGSATMPGNAVVVELLASQKFQGHCYSAGPDGDAVDSPEIPYFDQVVAEVEAEFCIDKSKVFVGGYSSGGWISSLMACDRANVVRGAGWAAAGLQKNHAPCGGPVAALITVSMDDGNTPQDQAKAAVEDLRTRNGCATTTKPWTPTWSATEPKATTTACVSYDGCMPGYPLVWCPTNGVGHSNTENDSHLTKLGVWKLFTSL